MGAFALASQGGNEIAQGAHVPAVHDVACRGAGAVLVHAHVQGRVGVEAEPAGVLVQLQGGDADVDEGAVDALPAGLVQRFLKLGEAAVHGADAGAEGRQASARHAERLGIAVEPHELQAGTGLEQGLGMSAQPQGAVEEPRAVLSGQWLEIL